MRRDRARRRGKRPKPPEGVTGSVVATVWALFVTSAALTGVMLWQGVIRHEHVHIPVVLVVADPFFALVGVLVTVDWVRKKR